ncbi:hypothetical protein CPB85DRAFT_1325467 [Mucidula mucida]|nr:hypothetical protein CPB85DRAFT_1325467 [Mucidula mucida]
MLVTRRWRCITSVYFPLTPKASAGGQVALGNRSLRPRQFPTLAHPSRRSSSSWRSVTRRRAPALDISGGYFRTTGRCGPRGWRWSASLGSPTLSATRPHLRVPASLSTTCCTLTTEGIPRTVWTGSTTTSKNWQKRTGYPSFTGTTTCLTTTSHMCLSMRGSA